MPLTHQVWGQHCITSKADWILKRNTLPIPPDRGDKGGLHKLAVLLTSKDYWWLNGPLPSASLARGELAKIYLSLASPCYQPPVAHRQALRPVTGADK